MTNFPFTPKICIFALNKDTCDCYETPFDDFLALLTMAAVSRMLFF